MNQKICKMFRKYAKQHTSNKESANILYKKLKAEYKEHLRES